MRDTRRLPSIRSRLFWVALTCVLPLLIAAPLAIRHVYQQDKEQLAEQLRQVARALTQTIDSSMLAHEAALKGLASSPYLDSGDLAALYSQARFLLNEGAGSANITLVDRTLQQRINLAMPRDASSLPKHGKWEAAERAFATGKTQISGLYRGPFLKVPQTGVLVPVIRDGQIRYLLTGVVFPRTLADMLAGQRLPAYWTAMLVDQDDIEIARSAGYEQHVGQKLQAAWRERFGDAREGFVEIKTDRADAIEVAFVRSTLTNWTVIISAPTSKVIDPLWQGVAMAVAGLLVLLCIGLVMAWRFAAGISRPVNALAAAARGAARGEAQEFPAEGPREVAQLSEDFRSMLDVRRRIEADLAERENLLQIITNQSPEAIFMIDGEARLRFANATAQGLLRRVNRHLTPEEMLGRTSEELCELSPEFGRALTATDLQVLASGKIDTREETVGSLYFDTIRAPLRNPAGEIIGLVRIARDLSERKKNEATLRERETLYQAIFEQPLVGVARSDVEGRLLAVNNSYCEMLGYSREELLSLHVQDITHPDDLARNMELFATLVAGGPDFRVEKRYVRKDGALVWVHNSVIGIRNEAGKVTSVTAISQNLTERRRIEEALRSSEARFRKIFMHAATGIAMADLHGRFVQGNPAYGKMVGYSEEELRQTAFAELIHPDDREANLVEIRRLLNEEVASFEIENRYLGKSGHVVWVHKFVSLLRDEHDKPTHILALVTDITARKGVERVLREKEEAARNLAEELQQVMDAAPVAIWIARDKTCSNVVRNRMADEYRAFTDDPAQSAEKRLEAFDEQLSVREYGKVLAREENPIMRAASYGVQTRGCELELMRNGKRTNVLLGGASPLFDRDGNLRGAVAAFLDITERKKTEEALRLGEERLRVAKKVAGLGTYDFDVRGGKVICDALARKLWGLAPDVPVSHDAWVAHAHPDDRALVQAALVQAMAPSGKGIFQVEYRVLDRDGTVARTIAVTGKLFFEHNELVRVIGTVQNLNNS